ncbi:restriction endonuclease type II-like protein [Naematelia encephala]|uniref:Restriction endonuclease type II-like protein n=1 Tax=Naematelia encephala TaxID=71784 RepID=A0A1Y2ANZ0_9TREE|nr:restriction endonuclease type II-like protein [Naematelia encephala]
MDTSISTPTTGEPSSSSSMPPPAFQSASSVLKTPGNSLRNASGGQPPLPPPPFTPPTLSTSNTSNTSEPAGPVTPVRAKPINRPAASKNAIVYNAVQRRNPVLQSIKNVGIEIGDIVADYQVGTHNGVLFLSLKYHRLHPEYIHQRIEKMKNHYKVRILLVLCDITEHQQSLREITKIAIVNELTTFVAWTNDEVAQYLSTFKAYEHKGDETLKERIHQAYPDQLQHVLTSGKKVNKTDAENLASQFGSFANISRQHFKVLANVKGLGPTKVNSLYEAFNKPFIVGGLKRGEDGAAAAAGPNGAGGVTARGTISRASGDEDGGAAPRESVINDGDQIGTTIWRDPLDDDDDDERAEKRPRIDT